MCGLIDKLSILKHQHLCHMNLLCNSCGDSKWNWTQSRTIYLTLDWLYTGSLVLGLVRLSAAAVSSGGNVRWSWELRPLQLNTCKQKRQSGCRKTGCQCDGTGSTFTHSTVWFYLKLWKSGNENIREQLVCLYLWVLSVGTETETLCRLSHQKH